MSLLQTKLLFNVARNLSTSSARAGHWNKDWKPGKYPETEEEIKAAAKKYGLLPEEYKRIPDDGEGFGDYPNLKPFSAEARDPFYPWDYPEYRRNFGEVLHKESMKYGEDRYNVNMKPKHSLTKMLATFLAVVGGMYGIMLASDYTAFLPVAQHHHPKPGVTHYTYE